MESLRRGDTMPNSDVATVARTLAAETCDDLLAQDLLALRTRAIQRLLDRKDIWARVEAVATALVSRGQLSGPEVEDYRRRRSAPDTPVREISPPSSPSRGRCAQVGPSVIGRRGRKRAIVGIEQDREPPDEPLDGTAGRALSGSLVPARASGKTALRGDVPSRHDGAETLCRRSVAAKS